MSKHEVPRVETDAGLQEVVSEAPNRAGKSRSKAPRGRWIALLLATWFTAPAVLLGQQCPEDEALESSRYQEVSYEEMVRAISLEREKGYDLTASTNGSRLWAFTAFKLVEWARARLPNGPPLYIDPDAYFRAYREGALGPGEAVPQWVQVAYDYRQRTLIEYRTDNVVDSGESTNVPLEALAICTWWPESENDSDQFEYEDTISSPNLLIVNEREVRYYLMRFEQYFMWDEIQGVRGRPTSGWLKGVFWVIGTGKVEWSRMAITAEGSQVVHAHGSKFRIGKTTTVLIQPDGAGVKVPKNDSDLAEILAEIERDVEVRYWAWPF